MNMKEPPPPIENEDNNLMRIDATCFWLSYSRRITNFYTLFMHEPLVIHVVKSLDGNAFELLFLYTNVRGQNVMYCSDYILYVGPRPW